jgi:hypothetical protein
VDDEPQLNPLDESPSVTINDAILPHGCPSPSVRKFLLREATKNGKLRTQPSQNPIAGQPPTAG